MVGLVEEMGKERRRSQSCSHQSFELMQCFDLSEQAEGWVIARELRVFLSKECLRWSVVEEAVEFVAAGGSLVLRDVRDWRHWCGYLQVIGEQESAIAL